MLDLLTLAECTSLRTDKNIFLMDLPTMAEGKNIFVWTFAEYLSVADDKIFTSQKKCRARRMTFDPIIFCRPSDVGRRWEYFFVNL